MRSFSRLWTLALLGVILTAAALVGSSGATQRATLRLDGESIRPELAITSAQRARGLMFRRRAPRDGMLFVFPEDTTGGFWMKNTLVPLKIVFFNKNGKRVRKLLMTPCKQASCPIYEPRRVYRFALELPTSDRHPAKLLGPLAALRRLSEAAR